MNTYKLTIHDENVKNILFKYSDFTIYLNGVEVKASSAEEAREKANIKFNIMKACDTNPSLNIPDIPEVNSYWDLWLNPNYTKIELIK